MLEIGLDKDPIKKLTRAGGFFVAAKLLSPLLQNFGLPPLLKKILEETLDCIEHLLADFEGTFDLRLKMQPSKDVAPELGQPFVLSATKSISFHSSNV